MPRISAQDRILLDSFHPTVKREVEELFCNQHYTECARHIAIYIEEEVKEIHHTEQLKIQQTAKEMYGLPLMQSAFNADNGKQTITLANLATISGGDEQKGYKDIFSGFISGIRNPLGHTTKKKLKKEEVVYILFFASLLLYKLDNRLIT